MPSCYTTQSFIINCADAVGGISEVYIADFIDKGTPTINASGLITAWTDATNDFYTYQVRPETAVATQTAQTNDPSGTTFYETSLSFQLSGLDSNRELENDILNKGRFLVIFKSRGVTPKYFLMGYNNGCTMKVNGETGTAMGDFKGYKITAAAKEETYWYEVSSSIIDAITI